MEKRICCSLNHLTESFVELFILNVGYVNDPDTNNNLIIQIDALESTVHQEWSEEAKLQLLTTAFETILTTIHLALPPEPVDIEMRKLTFQNSFRLAAADIINAGVANIRDQQQQIKQNFTSDLLSGVVDDINKEMLIENIEPIHVFGNPATLNALLYKTQHGRDTHLPQRYLRRPLFRQQIVNENKIKRIYDIYERVALRLHMPLSRLIQYLINKKSRNREVHLANELIVDHLERNPPQENQNARLSDFIDHSIFATPPAFTVEEIQDMQQVYYNFIEHSNLSWKEK